MTEFAHRTWFVITECLTVSEIHNWKAALRSKLSTINIIQLRYALNPFLSVFYRRTCSSISYDDRSILFCLSDPIDRVVQDRRLGMFNRFFTFNFRVFREYLDWSNSSFHSVNSPCQERRGEGREGKGRSGKVLVTWIHLLCVFAKESEIDLSYKFGFWLYKWKLIFLPHAVTWLAFQLE